MQSPLGTHEICNAFLGDLSPGSCPGVATKLQVTGIKTEGFCLTQNLLPGHSWWNFLPSFNVALVGKRGDLPWHAINFTQG